MTGFLGAAESVNAPDTSLCSMSRFLRTNKEASRQDKILTSHAEPRNQIT